MAFVQVSYYFSLKDKDGNCDNNNDILHSLFNDITNTRYL